jgi:hypothetical protein
MDIPNIPNTADEVQRQKNITETEAEQRLRTKADEEQRLRTKADEEFSEDMEAVQGASEVPMSSGIHEARRRPIDCRDLDFGSVISVEKIERAYNVSRKDYKEFNLAKLVMRNFIENNLPDVLGTRIFIKNAGDGLRVLLPSEVAEEMRKRTQKAMKAMRKSADVGTDTARLEDLTQAQRAELHGEMAMNGIIHLAHIQGRKKKRNLLQAPVEEHKPLLEKYLNGEATPTDDNIQENEA